MEKDLKQVAEKYQSLSHTEKIELEAQAHGQTVNEWGSNRSEELTSLLECSWFHLENSEQRWVATGGSGCWKGLSPISRLTI